MDKLQGSSPDHASSHVNAEIIERLACVTQHRTVTPALNISLRRTSASHALGDCLRELRGERRRAGAGRMQLVTMLWCWAQTLTPTPCSQLSDVCKYRYCMQKLVCALARSTSMRAAGDDLHSMQCWCHLNGHDKAPSQ